MEQRDIDEERDLTGTYISIDAGDVESAIDPRTGKNITITGQRQRDATLTVWAIGSLGRVHRPMRCIIIT